MMNGGAYASSSYNRGAMRVAIDPRAMRGEWFAGGRVEAVLEGRAGGSNCVYSTMAAACHLLRQACAAARKARVQSATSCASVRA